QPFGERQQLRQTVAEEHHRPERDSERQQHDVQLEHAVPLRLHSTRSNFFDFDSNPTPSRRPYDDRRPIDLVGSPSPRLTFRPDESPQHPVSMYKEFRRGLVTASFR